MAELPEMIIYAKYRVEPRDVEAFKDLAIRMADEATSHDGCIFLDVAQDAADPTTFRLVESWRDQAALDKHFANTKFHDALREAQKLAIVEYTSDVYSVSGTKAVDMPSV